MNHPPTYVRTFLLHKVRENCHFLDHPPTPIPLRNIKMAPYKKEKKHIKNDSQRKLPENHSIRLVMILHFFVSGLWIKTIHTYFHCSIAYFFSVQIFHPLLFFGLFQYELEVQFLFEHRKIKNIKFSLINLGRKSNFRPIPEYFILNEKFCPYIYVQSL